MFIGSWTAGWYVDRNTMNDGSHDWSAIWWMPAIMAVVVAIFFFLFFKDKEEDS